MGKQNTRGLRELARLYGVQTDYLDISQQRRYATPEALLSALRALGAEISGIADAPEALRERRRFLGERRVEPVVVAWEHASASVRLNLPASLAAGPIRVELRLEDGTFRPMALELADLLTSSQQALDGDTYVVKQLPLPHDLPWGHHQLTLEFPDMTTETMVIAAPRKAFLPPRRKGERTWGVFAPLYALHREQSWGAGDFSDLQVLIDWVADQGGRLVATLPMLASYFDAAATHSPYAPASRLFWNEFYLDLRKIPELAACSEARRLLESHGTQQTISELRRAPLVDYDRQMKLKRRVLESLTDWFFTHDSPRRKVFDKFLKEHPHAEAYAFFQAAGERYGRQWRDWPTAVREQQPEAEVDERARRYHLYAQWQTDEQLCGLTEQARARGMAWYVDFPLGVDGDGYDVWREREAFAQGAAGGCPPDVVFTKGQNWGFPPLHPERLRLQKYRYLIASLRHHFQYANALRIDHVMGLHRLFWIPQGEEARNGVYVQYPAEELYALLSVESHRRQVWLVGENLGTVPKYVDRSLSRHGVQGMYVTQYEFKLHPEQPLRPVPHSVIASANTHDMPPFAAFWRGLDIEDRRDLGLLSEEAASAEQQTRAQLRQTVITFLRKLKFLAPDDDSLAAVLRANEDFLAASRAQVMLLNLEDLWLETEPQNTPNTVTERPNWRRKTRYSLEAFSQMPEVLEILHHVRELRRGNPMPEAAAAETLSTGGE
jgi:4-alpha-glucanotransferase